MIKKRRTVHINKRRILSIVAAVAFVASVLFGLIGGAHTARADFNANNLMDDYIFENTGTMNAGQIDAFLNSFPSSCISQNRGYAAADVTGYSPGGGYTYGSNVTAGNIIYHAAQAYGINPQVLIATLQKEQSLITGGSSICGDPHSINAAMGYDCPDGGGCPGHASTTGFSQQVIHGAWLLRFGQQRSLGNVNWAEVHGSWNNSDDPPAFYGGPMTQGTRARVQGGSTAYYDGYTTIDGSSVHMDTGATAALYWYTPHFHGNQSFETIFQGWFGATNGQGFQRVISSDSGDPRQWVVYGSIKQYIPDSQTIYAWNLQDTQLVTMPASQLGAISTGPPLGRLAILNTGVPTIYFMDNGQRHKIPYIDTYNAWGFPGGVISAVSAGLFTQPAQGDDLTYAIKDPGSSNTYMMDGGKPRQYQSSTVMAAWEGSATNYNAISSDYYAQIIGNAGSAITNTKIVNAIGQSYEVSGGGKYALWPSIAQLYPGTAQLVSDYTINRMPVGPNLSHLVKADNSPTIYLIDNGTKHQILWPDALTAWSGPNHSISTVNASFLSNITSGTSIGGYLADAGGQLYLIDHNKAPVPAALDAAYRNSGSVYTASSTLMSIYITSPATLTGFLQAPGQPSVYLLDNSGKLRHIEWPSKLDALGGANHVTQLSSYIIGSMSTTTSPSVFATDGTTDFMIDNGNKLTVAAGIKSDWGLSTPQTYSDGTLSRFPTVGTLGDKLRTSNGASVWVHGGVGYATSDANIASAWALQNGQQVSDALLPNTIPVYMLARFVRSSANGDNRTFVVDNGNWYSVDATQLANLGGTNAPTTYMDPALAPNTITAWTSVVVKDSHGTYFVIDGGGKRYFTNQQIIDQWTNFGSYGSPTVSDGFLNALPTRGFIERAIKGSSPSVYSADNGTKRHILYPDTYNRFYAPFINVTDQLINAMPNGADL
jgi:hypothetical protein